MDEPRREPERRGHVGLQWTIFRRRPVTANVSASNGPRQFSMVESSVTFRLDDSTRFGMLQRVFDALRDAKTDDAIDADNESWRSYFDEEALSHFWDPTPEELADWTRRWQATPVETRFTDPTLKTPWDFGSMIQAFHNGEYNLLRVIRTSANTGALQFKALACPYGGTGCMRALIECFGGTVTGEIDT